MEAQMMRMDSGRKTSLEQLLDMHQQLRSLRQNDRGRTLVPEGGFQKDPY